MERNFTRGQRVYVIRFDMFGKVLHVPRLEQLEQTLAVHRQSPNRKGDDQ